jgi:hypothetical protein
MRPLFRHIAPDRIQIRQGGGCLAIFGLPFFGAGIFMLLAMLGVVSMSNSGGAPERLGLTFMGLLFTMVGGVLSFGRAWTIVDGTRREVIKQVGLIAPMRSDTRRVDDYTAVVVEFIRGDSDSADKFPVNLKARAGQPLQLCSSTEYGDSRECAIAVAELLRFDFEDATTDHPVRLAPGQAVLPLQQRLQLDGIENESIPRPSDARSDVQRDQDSVRITIPIPRTHPMWIVVCLIPLIVVMTFFSPLDSFFSQTRTPDPVAWVFLGFLVLSFGVFPTMTVVNGLLRSRRGGTIVTVSSSGIRIQERGAWRLGPVKSLPAAEILDIDFSTSASAAGSARHVAIQQARSSSGGSGSTTSPEIGPRTERVLAALSHLVKAGGITVKTLQGLTAFGHGLSDDEIRYLHSIVRRALAGDRAA